MLPSALDAQFGSTYPRSAGFDTDIGAFIESSTLPSTEGSMARSIIYDDAVLGETFLPGEIFIFGGFTLRANSIGHLEQINSYIPNHQIIFGNLNYIADIRGDLIFEGFATLDLEQTIGSKEGSLEPIGLSAIMKLTTEDPEAIVSSASPESDWVPPIIGRPDSPRTLAPNSRSPRQVSMARRLLPCLALWTPVCPSKPCS